MRLLIRARNAEVAVEGARIAPARGEFDLVIQVRGDVRPGLINAHDHLHRNHYGRLGRPPYANACGWAADIQQRHASRIAAGRALPRRDALLEGAWKNLFAGVTTVVHHDPWENDFEHDFPLRVVHVAQADSLGMGGLPAGPEPGERFCIHLAEGIDGAAADEVRTLDDLGRLNRDLLAVHGVGMDADAVARFRASGAALAWCPSSNLFLFGRTAPRALLAEGLDVLLGSDSLLSGDGDLLDELRRARALGCLSDPRLDAATGETAARILGLPRYRLEPGDRADLILLARPFGECAARDVLLVMVGGALRVVHPDLLDVFGPWLPPGATRTRGDVTRWTSLH